MHYRIFADCVMIVHFAFILFVAAGALLTWRWPRVALLHLPALAWGIGTVIIGFPCPLTSLEKALQRRAGGHSYDGGFVDQYLEDVVYPEEYGPRLRAVAAVVILVGYLGHRRRRPGGLGAFRPRHVDGESAAASAAAGPSYGHGPGGSSLTTSAPRLSWIRSRAGS